MANDVESEEVFDEEELADGFIEEIVSEEDLEAVVEDAVEDDDGDGDELGEEEDVLIATATVPDEDLDVVDDADVELALDEVLAETILRTSVLEDDDEPTTDVDPNVEAVEAILPKQDDEFRCKSCRLLKKTSQLADKVNTLCRDCV